MIRYDIWLALVNDTETTRHAKQQATYHAIHRDAAYNNTAKIGQRKKQEN